MSWTIIRRNQEHHRWCRGVRTSLQQLHYISRNLFFFVCYCVYKYKKIVKLNYHFNSVRMPQREYKVGKLLLLQLNHIIFIPFRRNAGIVFEDGGTYFCRPRTAYFLHLRLRFSSRLRLSVSYPKSYSEYPPTACFGVPPLREKDPQRSCKCRSQQCPGEWWPRISQRVCQPMLEKHSGQESCSRGHLQGLC